MAQEVLIGPSSSVPLAGDGAASLPASVEVRATGMGRFSGILVVSVPTGTPAVVQENQDGTQTSTTLLQPNADGDYPFDVSVTLPYVTLHPGGVGGGYTTMEFTAQLVPASGGGSGGGSGGSGAGNEIATNNYSGAISQNAETIATIAVEAAKIRIANVVIVALDLLDYELLFYNAVGGTPAQFVGSVSLPAANAVQIAGDSEYLYSVEADLPYQNAGATAEVFASLSPRSGGKAATACTVKVTYYPEET